MFPFLKALRSGRVLLMDGAMGTELQRAGLKREENSVPWNETNRERVRAVGQAYLDAGAEVLLTNTFLLNANDSDLMDWYRALKAMPVADYFRLASLGPLAGGIGPREFDRLRHFDVPEVWGIEIPGVTTGLRRQFPDACLLETCSSPRVRFAIRRVRKEAEKLPVLLSLSYLRNTYGQLVTNSDHSPEWFAHRAETWGLAALGVNCGKDIGMDEVIEIVRRYRNVTKLPLFARPNAGTPKKGKYPLTPAEMARRLPELLEAGVCMVGGCCGTTPEHIAAMRPVIDEWNARKASAKRR
jgi:5-methyltetrahydrofolate--homocysteine methyltransferase